MFKIKSWKIILKKRVFNGEGKHEKILFFLEMLKMTSKNENLFFKKVTSKNDWRE